MASTNIKKVTKNIRELLIEQSVQSMERAGQVLVNDLKESTPVDTGFARASWNSFTDPTTGYTRISNDAPYIKDLIDKDETLSGSISNAENTFRRAIE